MNFVVGGLIALAIGLAAWIVWLRRRLDSAKRDVAKNRKAVRLLREEVDLRASDLARHRAVISGASVGIVVLDPSGSVVITNSAASEFLGARHGAAIAESHIRHLVQTVTKTGTTLREEFEIRSPIPRTLRVAAEMIEEGGWVVAYVDDVTERRKVDAARKDFVANVSHELKTPLGALALLAETLESADDPKVQNRLIARIGEQSARMNRLVDDILDLSLVEAAHDEWALVDLYKVVGAAAARVRDIAAAADVTLRADVPGGHLLVMGDERQLVSAVSNLLSNAVTYTAMAVEPREVTSTVTVADGEVSIAVADTGIGIPLKHQQRIFERFYRVDPGRSRETGGTGLGLSIVRHVAKNHGGRVEVESESGVGSEFRIVIPIGGET